nr:reverse transcriptase domain-containing protein [Tanacetum cinerariifolium]
MANADNDNRNLEPKEAPVAKKCSYKEFMSCQPFNFKGSEGAIGFIRWFERTKSEFSRSNYTEDYKMKFATGKITVVILVRDRSSRGKGVVTPIDLVTILAFTRKQLMVHDMQIMALEATSESRNKKEDEMR